MNEFFELARMQGTFMRSLIVVMGVLSAACILGAFVALIIPAIDQFFHAIGYWIKERRRQRELTDDAMRQIRQRELHDGIRKLAHDDARRRLEVVARTGDRR